MCGIAGMYHLQRKPVPAHCLKKMCDVMRYRGPDDEGYVFFDVRDEPYKSEGYWAEKGPELPSTESLEEWRRLFSGNGVYNLALGHRRLSIIDPSPAGHQPMSNRANGIWVTYNGEIYNYRELRRDLQEKGHRFFSNTDTEVLIHLYEEYGCDAINHLNGMFAFALWDGGRNRLFLARDRYGIKPLYYAIVDQVLYFASEIKAILQVPNVRAKLNYQALNDYFTFQNTFENLTLFEDINLLQPGHYLVLQGERISEEAYWDFSFDDGVDQGSAFYSTRMRQIFESVIERQMLSDVPLGSYLSGGLDSGSITAFASKKKDRLMTFTGGFDVATAVSIEGYFDERDKAELVSSKYGTEHYQMVIHAGDLQWALPRVVYHSEDLRMGMSYPHYYLSRLASKFVKVVLAGAGGDETLCGYPWRYDLLKECHSARQFEETAFGYWSRLVKEQEKEHFFSRRTRHEIGDHSSFESFRKVLGGTPNGNPIKKALYFDAKTFLHGILVIEDKLSMAHSLESRVPFLDNELVDFTTKVPTAHLLNDSWCEAAKSDINLSGKYILREAMQGILPKEIIENRKQGFSAPEQSWYMQQLVQYIRDMILCERSLDRGYFQKDYIERMLDEHIQGKANHRLLIWSLLSFEWWNRIFLDGEEIEVERNDETRRK